MQVPIFTDFHEKLFSGATPHHVYRRSYNDISPSYIRRITDIFYGADYDL